MTSDARPLRVAIIGTGPSGMYAAGALLQAEGIEASIDLFDRLPTPWGLVRYGVAPDHQKIKMVTRVFEKVAADPRVRFFGNVGLGRDLDRQDLHRFYHAVVYAVGAQGDRELGIPGEELQGSWSSTELVAWYNCHPDWADSAYPLQAEQVAVVGIGNVAIDVARILAKSATDLECTDIADHALEELRCSRVQQIHVLARRGPAQAKCTPAELKELGRIEGAQVVVDPAELELDPESRKVVEEDRSAAKNLELFEAFAAEPPRPGHKHIRFRFLVSPVEIVGEDGRVRALRLERNRLVPRGGRLSAEGTGEIEQLPVGLVVRAIGYRSRPLVDLPYDARRGIVANREGRVVAGEEVLAGDYVVGWVKRGPTGLIGTNKMDAQESIDHLLEDVSELPEPPEPDPQAIVRLLEERGVRFVDYPEWERLDSLEVARGEAAGRPRVKFPRIEQMLRELETGEP